MYLPEPVLLCINTLEQAGFEFLTVWGDDRATAPTETTQRWYFAARAKK